MLCCAVSAVGFGSNYVPLKQVDCGDGFFFSAMMSIGIAIVGLLVNWSPFTSDEIFQAPQFEPWAMVGGAAWMLGNLMTPFIVRCLGLGIGLSVWDLSNMFVGWATGNFGLFGVWREQVHSPVMNYTGLALAGVSLVLFAQAVEGGEEEHTDAKDAQRSGSDGAAEASPEAMEEGCGVAPESQVLDCPIDVATKSAADIAGAMLSPAPASPHRT